jgi:nicotinamide-nucleotide amidase
VIVPWPQGGPPRGAGQHRRPLANGRLGDAVSLDKLSLLPEGAEVLDPNAAWPATCFATEGKPLFLLPGVPPQMEILLLRQGDARPAGIPPQNTPVPVCQRVYRTCGLREVEINKRLLRPGSR